MGTQSKKHTMHFEEENRKRRKYDDDEPFFPNYMIQPIFNYNNFWNQYDQTYVPECEYGSFDYTLVGINNDISPPLLDFEDNESLDKIINETCSEAFKTENIPTLLSMKSLSYRTSILFYIIFMQPRFWKERKQRRINIKISKQLIEEYINMDKFKAFYKYIYYCKWISEHYKIYGNQNDVSEDGKNNNLSVESIMNIFNRIDLLFKKNEGLNIQDHKEINHIMNKPFKLIYNRPTSENTYLTIPVNVIFPKVGKDCIYDTLYNFYLYLMHEKKVQNPRKNINKFGATVLKKKNLKSTPLSNEIRKMKIILSSKTKIGFDIAIYYP